MNITKKIKKKNLTYILIGMLAPLQISIIGIISPLEILSTFYFFSSLFNRKIEKSEIFNSRIFISLRLLFFLWAGSQIISDILNKTKFNDSLKGVGTPILIFITLIFLIQIYEKNDNDPFFVRYYFFGHSLSFILIAIPQFLAERDIYFFLKWNILTYSAIFALTVFSKKIYKIISIAFFGFIAIVLQIRSTVLIFGIYLLSILSRVKKAKNRYKDLNIFKVILGGLLNFFLVILILFLTGPFYSLATKGIIGFSLNSNKSELIDLQKGNFFDTRIEYYSYFRQFIDSPIIGHGSWAEDKDLKYNLLIQRKNPLVQQQTDNNLLLMLDEIALIKDLDSVYIPVHSFLMQVITWGGIFSGLFFLYLLNLNIFMLGDRNLNDLSRVFLSLNVFNIFFSPLGKNRYTLPIICFLTVIYYLDKQIKNK